MNIKKSGLNTQGLMFKGHKKSLDKTGYEKHDFCYLYDSDKYNCELELYNIKKDKKGNISISNEKPVKTYSMPEGKISVDIDSLFQLDTETGFAYRFKLTDKKTKEASYAYDNGSVINIFDDNDSNNKYNVVYSNRATINKNGPMQLIMPDFYYPGVENRNGKPEINEGLRAKALTSVRTHANRLGGNLYGIIERLPKLKEEGVSRIVGTPFTRDTVSSHLYWTENAYQVAPQLGTEEEYKELQRQLFKNGINWIADAALVNEGFGGIHFSELLRKGQDSFSKNMFRVDEKVSLGILPDNSKYTRMKIINAPFLITKDNEYQKNNPNYNPSKPTYIQFYDDRLASEEQKTSDSIVRLSAYDNKNTDNIYEITKHDDAVYPFPIEVSPSELGRNVRNVISLKGEVDLSDISTIKQIADFTNFNVVNKSEAKGLEVWDGNVDIAKLNFYKSDMDDERFIKYSREDRQKALEEFKRGTLAVRDYAVNSGKYWTKLTNDTQLEYAADVLKKYQASNAKEYMNAIKKLTEEGMLPQSILENTDEEVIQNVLDDEYNLRIEDYGNDYDYNDYILKQSMELPLETIPVASNLLGIITSPYIEKKANTEDELGVSRYELTKSGNPNLPQEYNKTYTEMDNIYKNSIVPLIEKVLEGVDGLKNEDGTVSVLGKYVISQVAPDLTKYIFLKALNKNEKVEFKPNGQMDFSSVNGENITMQSIGIPFEGKTSEQEAQMLLSVLKQGIASISDEDIGELQANVKKRFDSVNENDYKIAEMILDRTESGLGWRIDASKDIASIDSVRAGVDDMNNIWDRVIDFWKLYNQSILEINPHAYTTAEITDLYDLITANSNNHYKSDGDAERKFLQETGITSIANYSYFFSLLPELFSLKQFEMGYDSGSAMNSQNIELRKKLDEGWSHEIENNPGFLFQSPEDGVVNSYTFIGNHDKPRVLHCLSLDMGLFNSDFSADKKSKNAKGVGRTHRSLAAEVLMKPEKSIDFQKVSSQAVAMGLRIDEAIDSVVKDETLKNRLKESVSQLANGEYKGEKFDALAFGTRPFEVAIKTVFDNAEYTDDSPIENRDKTEAMLLKNILEPAFDRFYSMYKLLITLPGSPTDFAGDRVGASGYETKAKNYHQQNRNIIHWEWLDDDNYKFVSEFYNNMNKIANLRNNPKLSALNDGATVTLPISTFKDGRKSAKDNLQAFLRYNDKDSVIITLHDSSGSNTHNTLKMQRNTTETSVNNGSISDRIVLNSDIVNAKQGLKHGLKEGTKFKNNREGDDSVYKIAKMTVNENNQPKEYYYIRREDTQGREIPIKISPEDFNTLILYKI